MSPPDTRPSPLALLQQVDRALQQSESTTAALSSALRVLLPHVCQQGLLSIDERDGSTAFVTAFVDPELERLALEVSRRFPPKPRVHPMQVAVSTGSARAYEVDEELLGSIAHDVEHLALLRRFGASQLLVLPLRSRGRNLGVLALSTEGGRQFTPDDRALAELVATRLALHLDAAHSRRHVLVVDDNEAHRYLLRRALLLAGFDVREADTGAEALRLAREGKTDVLVLDLHLPDMLGFDVCRQLKLDERTLRIPIIQLSAEFVSAEDRQNALSHGADEFLMAPVDPGSLVAAVRAILRAGEEEVESRRTIDRERVARLELERANARLRAVTESGLLGTFEWDSDGLLVDANDGFLRLVGYTREDVLARRLALSTLLPGAVAALQISSTPLVVERELLAKDGKAVAALIGMARIPEQSDRGVAFVLDVSEQRRRTELEALLVGIVSHDLRNPLGVIAMAVSLLCSQELSDAQRKLVHRIEVAGRKSARLIADLLDFTAARGAGIPLSREPGDLHDVVAQAIDDLHATWPGRSILHERVGDAVCHLDAARFEQIASNLIGNALQHSPVTGDVHIETRGDCDTVSFSVQNRGKPISTELMAQLFFPLRRGDNAGHRRGSLGLGLFIVHHLVSAHGGTIDVASNEADGTRFTVRLPRSRAGRVPSSPSGARVSLHA